MPDEMPDIPDILSLWEVIIANPKTGPAIRATLQEVLDKWRKDAIHSEVAEGHLLLLPPS